MLQEGWNQAVELARFLVECFGKFCTRYSGVISLSSLIIAAGILIRIIMAIGKRSLIDREYTAQRILKMECLFVCIFFLRFCEAACVKCVALPVFAAILISSIIVLGITLFSWIRDQSWISDQMNLGHLSRSSGIYLFSGFYMLLLFVILMFYYAVYKESDHESLRFTSTTIESSSTESSSDEEVGTSN